MSKFSESATIEGLTQTRQLATDVTNTVVSAATLTLATTAAYLQSFSGTVAGQIVRLPDATSLPVGYQQELVNNSTVDIIVQDNTGVCLLTLLSGVALELYISVNGSAAGTWGFTVSPFVNTDDNMIDPKFIPKTIRFTDFDFSALGASTNDLSFVAANNLGGTATLQGAVVSPFDYLGLITISHGLDNNGNGRGGIAAYGGVGKIALGFGKYYYYTRFRIPILSAASGASLFSFRTGLMNTTGNGDPTAGIYWTIDGSANSGRPQLVVRSASISTIQDSSLALAANTWYELGYVVNAAGTSVEGFVNDLSNGAAITTNIPTSQALFPTARVEKGGTTTVVPRNVAIDWMWWRLGGR